MYSREDSKQIRQEFWTSFGKNYPRKWVLYNTKIKDFALKFHFDRTSAEVSIEVGSADEVFRKYYFEKLESLQSILKKDFLPAASFEADHELESGKLVSRVFVRKEGVNIHSKQDWPEVQAWLADNMYRLEGFFVEYRDIIAE